MSMKLFLERFKCVWRHARGQGSRLNKEMELCPAQHPLTFLLPDCRGNVAGRFTHEQDGESKYTLP